MGGTRVPRVGFGVPPNPRAHERQRVSAPPTTPPTRVPGEAPETTRETRVPPGASSKSIPRSRRQAEGSPHESRVARLLPSSEEGRRWPPGRMRGEAACADARNPSPQPSPLLRERERESAGGADLRGHERQRVSAPPTTPPTRVPGETPETTRETRVPPGVSSNPSPEVAAQPVLLRPFDSKGSHSRFASDSLSGHCPRA